MYVLLWVWVSLAAEGIVLDDYLRYWLFNEEKHTIDHFKKKKGR